MSEYSFDKVVERRNTGSAKWDMVDTLYRGKDLLPFWVADMDFKVPTEVIDALQQKVSHGVFGYPAHSPSANSAVINWLATHFHWNIEAQSILFTSGIIPTINNIIQAFSNEGDEIIIQTPVYPPFYQLVTNNNRELVKNPLKYEQGTYKMDFEHLESVISDNTKMLILCSPHNPVGRVWKKDELEQLADICKRHNLLVISDEIHADLLYDGHSHTPIASVSEDMAKRTFTCLTPSKSFNLAEFHTSYVVIEEVELRSRLKKHLAIQFQNTTNSFGEIVTEAAYTYGESWLKELRMYLKGNYDFVKAYFEKHIPLLSIIKPEGTYLLWIDCSKLELSSTERKRWLVEDAKVALNHGPTFGEEGESFERMNIACPRKTLEEGLERIHRAYQKLNK
ncbi:MalY/PatB family protein [Bacillus sp. FJAT-45350]|uniref:MalY/PatB family protein n=1 Tax=Bacillus sp. FJAT-45350 TaxID=2011014 RepID=UPI000BB86354|nr:MalY/PatB family protein [Bacillus sp. FJAT-45350]